MHQLIALSQGRIKRAGAMLTTPGDSQKPGDPLVAIIYLSTLSTKLIFGRVPVVMYVLGTALPLTVNNGLE